MYVFYVGLREETNDYVPNLIDFCERKGVFTARYALSI